MCWRSQAGQPAAMQEEGCEALGPRRGSGRAGVLLSRRRLRKESEEGENMPYIGPVTSQVMGLRVTNGS